MQYDKYKNSGVDWMKKTRKLKFLGNYTKINGKEGDRLLAEILNNR